MYDCYTVAEKCPLCKGLSDMLPGYAADPYNCQGFYSCVKFGDTWVAYHMMCADCLFWNQEILTCVLVASDTCRTTTPEPIEWALPSAVPIGACGAELGAGQTGQLVAGPRLSEGPRALTIFSFSHTNLMSHRRSGIGSAQCRTKWTGPALI